ncbi:alpha/beta hydrolase [Antrihabitans stalactiti]|uniref:Alpha/beta hydrolase n=1 Tax=Antrihabitans stalactiti TaxID=2584121 RepID=A0A848K5I3_9NOCA|nr:alpha/beta hydrolase [Antrihabitans stalactiti]NMN94003.1 alpha/beta hydrolase [Antrihabitans stalactiti]
MPLDDVHPDLRLATRLIPGQLAVGRFTLPFARIAFKALRPIGNRHAEVMDLSSNVKVRLFRPPNSAVRSAALLWIHGGGYVLGAAIQDDTMCRRLSDRLGITVVSVDYRLAPEHPYPAALHDCYDALTWLAALPEIDPTRIAIGGMSAGGGLAAALAILARDRGEVTPAFQLLTYPMLDDRTEPGSEPGRYRVWNPRSNHFGWQSYLGEADPAVAVPARQVDLSRLAPAWIGVGTHDLFHDEGIAYARRLEEAGVPCQLELVPGAFHGFDQVVRRAPVTRAFFDAQCASLRTALGVSSA